MKRLPFLLVVCLLIFLRFFQNQVHFQDGQKVRITENVRTEPIRYNFSQSLKIAGLKTALPLYPEINYGDRIVVEGLVAEDRLISPVLVKIKASKNVLFLTREKIIAFYRQSLPEPHASLVAGVTLGSRATLPSAFWQSLKNSGTAHVVVASGMNVTLVAGGLLSTLVLFVKRKQAVFICIIAIWIYALICGFDAPIVRAAVMGSLAFAALGLGRLSLAGRALIIAGSVMLLLKPSWLLDLGFWLSFVATGSLILFQKPLEKMLHFVPSIIRGDLATSLAAQIGVAPILYYTFGYISILSPLINALVLWTIAPLTVIGMLAGLISLISPFMAGVILYLTYPLSSWFILIVHFF